MPIDFIDLKSQYRALKSDVDARIQRVLDHGQYIMGPEVWELEERLAHYTGAQHCITCASGTDALLISLMALGIGPGDEVITTPFSFAANAEVIARVGATPVFVDIQPDTCNIDPARIEAAISSHTRAVMPVSLYGQPSDMETIGAIALKHRLAVIEDAAQSFGASVGGRKSCNLSAVGCTSFYPSKPLGCYGDGGAIFTSDDVIAKAMRELRDHGQQGRYNHIHVGVSGRMDTLQCAVVLAKLEGFDAEIARRVDVGKTYIELLSHVDGLQLPVVQVDCTCVWSQFTLQTNCREALISELKTAGVPTAVHYPLPLHRQPAFRDRCRIAGSLKYAESASSRVVSLPMHPYLDRAAQTIVSDAVIAALKSCGQSQHG